MPTFISFGKTFFLDLKPQIKNEYKKSETKKIANKKTENRRTKNKKIVNRKTEKCKNKKNWKFKLKIFAIYVICYKKFVCKRNVKRYYKTLIW